MLATFVMWILIIERYWHFATSHKTIASSTIDAWNKRSDHDSGMLEELERDLLVKSDNQVKEV